MFLRIRSGYFTRMKVILLLQCSGPRDSANESIRRLRVVPLSHSQSSSSIEQSNGRVKSWGRDVPKGGTIENDWLVLDALTTFEGRVT